MTIEDHMMNPNDPAEREWLTWRQVCKQLEALGIHPNSDAAKPLMAAIKLWGEENAVLNHVTPADYVNRVHQEARDAYEEHVLDGWAP